MSDYHRERFGGIPILPRSVYRDTLARFVEAFEIKGDWRSHASYPQDRVLLAMLSGIADAIDVYGLIKSGATPTPYYLALTHHSCGKLFPEGECYFLSLRDPADEVIFRCDTETLGTFLSEEEEGHEYGEFLVIGSEVSWAALVSTDETKEPRIETALCVGAPILENTKKYLYNNDTNKNAALMSVVREQVFEPALPTGGSIEQGRSIQDVRWTMDHGDYRTLVRLLFRQKTPQDALTVRVSVVKRPPKVNATGLTSWQVAMKEASTPHLSRVEQEWNMDVDSDISILSEQVRTFIDEHRP